MDRSEQLAGMILASRRVVVLTGAGISTDSGIPDFRSPGEGLWERYDPTEVLSVEALYMRPRIFYTIGFQILSGFDARPNRAHEILAHLETAGLVRAIITQNIDGLHQQAGSQRVIEVHGHLRTCHCMNCGRQEETSEVTRRVNAGEIPPKCLCGGIMRPDVVLFGDPMPRVINDAMAEAMSSDLLLVLGSSLTVSPVCDLPYMAGRVAIINREDTPCDMHADLVWRSGITPALEAVETALRNKGAL